MISTHFKKSNVIYKERESALYHGIKTRYAYDFPSCFPHELIMSLRREDHRLIVWYKNLLFKHVSASHVGLTKA